MKPTQITGCDTHGPRLKASCAGDVSSAIPRPICLPCTGESKQRLFCILSLFRQVCLSVNENPLVFCKQQSLKITRNILVCHPYCQRDKNIDLCLGLLLKIESEHLTKTSWPLLQSSRGDLREKRKGRFQTFGVES